jgi:type VI secretion system protein
MTAARRTLLLAVAWLPGCSLLAKPVWVRSIEFRVAESANDDTPIAVDVVYLTADPGLTEEITRMSAEDWFSRKDQLRRDFRNDLDVASWELVPGSIRHREKLAKPRVSEAGFLFARYHAPGPHRYRLTTEETAILVKLDAADFSVTTQ